MGHCEAESQIETSQYEKMHSRPGLLSHYETVCGAAPVSHNETTEAVMEGAWHAPC